MALLQLSNKPRSRLPSDDLAGVGDPAVMTGVVLRNISRRVEPLLANLSIVLLAAESAA